MPYRAQHHERIALLEREPEVAAAARAVEALRSERATGGLLIYSGEAGLGKTSLLAEVSGIATARGCTVRTARGSETATSVPFHVVRQLLQPALGGMAPDEARELFGDWYDITAPALGIAAPSGPPADPQGVRDGLDRVVTALSERLRKRPLVVLVDDAHWSDGESLGWLVSFATRLSTLPLLIVIAHRPEDASDTSSALLNTAGTAARLRIPLRELTAEAVSELVRATVGEGADDAFCREVWTVTHGNPYEAVELIAKVQDHSLEPVGPRTRELRALGATARGSGLVSRLEGLGPDATRFAWAAAVLGTDISLGLAASLAGMPPAKAAACAERLREARIVTGPDPLEFVHPLIATAVYRAIPPALCTAMHGRAAWAVTEAGLGSAAASRHLLEVHPDDDQEVVRQLREAARDHLAVGAPEAACRCLERALQEPPRSGVRAQVLYELGCATLLTSPPTTIRHLRQALDLPGLDRGLRVDATYRLAQALAHNDQLSEAAVALATEAGDTPPGPARMRLQAAQFLWEGTQARENDGPARSRRLAELADRLPGRDNAERALLTIRAFDAMLRGEDAELVVELCDRALVDGRPAPGLGWTDTEWGFEPPALAGISYAFTDRLDHAEELFTEAVRAYEISGWSGAHLAFAHTLLGLVHRRRGNLPEAESFLREGLRLADRIGSGLPVHWISVGLLIDTLLARGDTSEAETVAERYAFRPPYPNAIVIPDGPSVRGRLLLATGHTKEGVAELEAGGGDLEVRGRHNGVWAPWSVDLARAIAAESPARAAQLTTRARAHAERFGTGTAIGEALRCAAALAPEPEAVPLLARAVRHLEASPSGYEHARARYEYGLALRSSHELTRAADLAATCGATTLAARAREACVTILAME
ncbi:AAA family ATPase [Streptomyces sp. SCSIO 30461]|uniref:ATP-binding protein n=1 Tax=Streptomyces sp. SCSIO 30461 TaxID=3118085 RepID=UPI0030D42752